MTDRESRLFFLGAALAAALLIGGSFVRDTVFSDGRYSRIVSAAPHGGGERK